MRACGRCRCFSPPGARRAEVAAQGSVSSARILLCSTEREPEAISTVQLASSRSPSQPSQKRVIRFDLASPLAALQRLILQQMVQQQLRIATFRVRSLKDIAAASSASFALVLLSQGVLEDPDFALQIGQMRAMAASSFKKGHQGRWTTWPGCFPPRA